MRYQGLPPKQGLYDPQLEKDSCGIGFIAHIKGKRSHQMVEDGLTILNNLAHRGACGCDPRTGDGAGLLIQLPHAFFKQEGSKLNINIPSEGEYGAGIVFLPQEKDERAFCMTTLEQTVKEEGQVLLGWRDVPVVSSSIGPVARSREPHLKQIFIGKNAQIKDQATLERKLLVIRKMAERKIAESDLQHKNMFYICSLSTQTFVYKGQLMSEQLHPYFPDLASPAMESALAMVHSRYSTNTFPSWDRAHPYRFIAHNGEINTLRGNINWMHARETLLSSPIFGDDIKKLMPVINPDGSDSAMFDNVVEMLVAAGRSLPHAMLMMVPEAWSGNELMDTEKKAFYEYHSTLMEPWDGPASMGFTDGRVIGALLDRNGLRPSRFVVTKDDRVIMASEVGVLPVDPANVLSKGRLQPGKMLLVDMNQGRIIADEEIKNSLKNPQAVR